MERIPAFSQMQILAFPQILILTYLRIWIEGLPLTWTLTFLQRQILTFP